MYAFHDKLKEIIDRSLYSKNQIIRELGFDRSVFFKILSGERIPTERQFSLILHLILEKSFCEHSMYKENPDLLQKDLDSLLALYLSERLDKASYELWSAVKSSIEQINRSLSLSAAGHDNSSARPDPPFSADETLNPDISSGQALSGQSPAAHEEKYPDPVLSKVSGFIREELSSGHARLDFRLSSALIDRFHIHAAFSGLLTPHIQIRQILSCPPGGGLSGDITVILRNFVRFIDLIDSDPCGFAVYCAPDSDSGRSSDIFPWYLLGENRLLLIPDDGSDCTLVTDPALVGQWHRQFESVIRPLQPLFLPVNDYMGLARELLVLNKKIGRIPVIFAADRPCFWQLATDEIIEKYTDDPSITAFAAEYARTIQGCHNLYTILSPEGLEDFRADRFISEAGLNLQLDDEDMLALHQSFAQREGRQMIQVPFSGCLVRGWETAVYSPDLAIIFPFAKSDKTIRILNREIIRALFVFYDTLRRCCSVYYESDT